MKNFIEGDKLSCSQCKKPKSTDSFDKTNRKVCVSRGGHTHVCKSCNNDNSFVNRWTKRSSEDIVLEIKRANEKLILLYMAAQKKVEKEEGGY